MLEDVQDPVIEKVLLTEYSTILESIVLSATVYQKFTDTHPPNEALFRQVFHASAKRMNLEMMLLVDCV